jgi:hypothetical protein
MSTINLAADKVANLTGSCRIYEMLYLPNNCDGSSSSSSSQSPGHGADGIHPARKEFAAALLGLNIAVLRLLAAALYLYNKNAALQALRALLDLAKVTNLLGNCQTLKARINIEAGNCERASSAARHKQLHVLLQALLQAFQAPVLRIDARVATVWERSNAAQRAAILRWTTRIAHGNMHGAVRHGQTPGAAKWLLAHERLVEWRSCSASTILWLHGIWKPHLCWELAPPAIYAMMWLCC